MTPSTRTVLTAALAALAMATLLAERPAMAADTTSAGDSVRVEAPAPPTGFPVVLGPNELFRVHAAVRGRGADERAAAISRGLIRFARDPGFAPESVRVIEGELASEIVSRDVFIMGTWDADTVGTGRSREQLAHDRAEILRAAILRYRTDNSVRTLLMASLWTVLATLGLVLALAVLGRLHARLRGVVRAWCDARREFIRKKSFSLLEMEQVASFLGGVGGLIHVLLVIGAIYLYVSTVLAFFPATRPLSGRLATFVLEPFRVLATGFIDHLPGYIFLAILFWGSTQLIRLLKLLFVAIEAGRLKFTGFYPEWAMPTYRLVRILVVALAVVVGYPYIPGSDSDAFKGVSIFFGVLVSLGSSSMVSNVVAGIVITYMRSFRIGEVVQVGEHRGRVVETTMFVTRIRTMKNVEISIPNSLILGSNVVNYSAQAASGLVLHSEVTIGYQWPWRQVHALLLRAAERTDGLLPEPKPFVLQRSLGGFGVEYQINVLTDQPHRMDRIYSQLHRNIQDQFNEFGVEIMTPAYEGDRSEPTIAPRERWYAPPAKQPGEPGADE